MSWRNQMRDRLRARSGLIGPGHLVLVVGPSGAGKDTLLAHVRTATRDDERVIFPRRVITRAPDGTEDHDSLSDAEFERAQAEGAFAAWWGAHGNRYGNPVSVNAAIRAGRTVVCNVSRSVVASLRERYCVVTVVLVTAPTDVLRQRLAARRRSSDGDLAKRIERADAPDCKMDPDVVITNVGAPTMAASKLLDIVRTQGSESSVWGFF
jgi:ribose 1,5-bisphosphokinase